MTKSISKAVIGDVLIKGKVGDKEPSFINPNDLKVNNIELIKRFEKISRELSKQVLINEKQADNNLLLTKHIETLENNQKALEAKLKQTQDLLKDTIESWVKL